MLSFVIHPDVLTREESAETLFAISMPRHVPQWEGERRACCVTPDLCYDVTTINRREQDKKSEDHKWDATKIKYWSLAPVVDRSWCRCRFHPLPGAASSFSVTRGTR